MGFISEIFGYLLNWLYEIFNNYGVAILIFSVILRVILIPITIKQQKSMKKSAALQTEMSEIQKKYFEDYYFNNYSLSEISENYNVTRNAVHKSIKEAEKNLNNFEEKLGYANKIKRIKELNIDNKIKEQIIDIFE